MKTLYSFLILILAVNIHAQTEPIKLVDLETGKISLALVNMPEAFKSIHPTTINGLSGNISLPGFVIDPASNSLIYAPVNPEHEGKGGTSLSDATITGKLTVTNGCLLNTASGFTSLGRSSSHNPGVLVFNDTLSGADTIVTAQTGGARTYTIPDAGSNGAFAVRVAVPAHSTDAGVIGDYADDDSNHYWYTSTGWVYVTQTSGTSW